VDAADTADPAAEVALAWITAAVLGGVARGESSPAAVLFLLRRYIALGDPSLRTAVETGLARGVEAVALERDPRERCQWLGLLADASSMAEDDNLAVAVNTRLADTIDDLEQLIRAGYEPGDGLVDASLSDQLRTAAALLTAFDLTGRLPYSMLAEELLQVARRTAWDNEQGTFRIDVAGNSLAVQVMCRLAALHHDPSYTERAVVAASPSYEADAARILDKLAATYRGSPSAAADYGLALLERFALNAHPN
jgi:uncharacterized protein YyaL (SSP411 family)